MHFRHLPRAQRLCLDAETLRVLCAGRRLSPRGPVLSAEESTPAGIFIPTQLESSWILPDGRRRPYASFTVARVTAE